MALILRILTLTGGVIIAATIYAFFLASTAAAASGFPDDFIVDQIVPVPGYKNYLGHFSGAKYCPPGLACNSRAKGNVIVPDTGTGLQVIVQMQGWPALTYCDTPQGGRPGAILIRICSSSYPDPSDFPGMVDWMGPFGGTNNAGNRLATITDWVFRDFEARIDATKGQHVEGISMGGTGALLQTMSVPAINSRQRTTTVFSRVPALMIMEDHYPADPAIRNAFRGYPVKYLYHEWNFANNPTWRNTYFSVHGNSNDTNGPVPMHSTRFFELCDQYEVACYGTWDTLGHDPRNELSTIPATKYPGPLVDLRVGAMVPAITGLTSNIWGSRGHYNFGISWFSAWSKNTRTEIVLPLRYLPRCDMGLPCPQAARFNLTLRRAKVRAGELWDWSFGDASGTVEITENNIVRIVSEETPAIPISAGPFKPLVLTRSVSLVYTRAPNPAIDPPGIMEEVSNWVHTTGTGRLNAGIAEADVVHDNLSGQITVIHDCTTVPEICVAQEARVSPDGKRIVYSVGYGNTLVDVMANGVITGLKDIPGLTRAELWVYEFATKQRRRLTSVPFGVIDRQPEWINNRKIVFVSNRRQVFPPKAQYTYHENPAACSWPCTRLSMHYPASRVGMSMQLHTMNIDGTGIRNIAPHDQNALSPTVLSNGDIVYSCAQLQGMKPYKGTPLNSWWLCRTDQNGADTTVIMGGHNSALLKTRDYLTDIIGGEGLSQLRAIRCVGEIRTGYLAFTNYYRSNHQGCNGIIYGFAYRSGTPWVEGVSILNNYEDHTYNSTARGTGRYTPSDLKALTPYGTDQDTLTRFHRDGRAAGKAGYPAPYPGPYYLFSHARGNTYEATFPEEANRAAMGGEPTSHRLIALAKTDLITNPFDTAQMEYIACTDEAFHCWDARAVVPYQLLHGKPMPDQQPPPIGDECHLAVVDITASERELYRTSEWEYQDYDDCKHQGCFVDDIEPAFLTVNLIERHTVATGAAFANSNNHQGWKSIRHYGSVPAQADGSVKMRVPCETEFVITGTDVEGRKVADDTMVHSLRTGETRFCHGCHDGHSVERQAALGESPKDRFARTAAAQLQAELMVPEDPVTFYADVRPILVNRCFACHDEWKGDYLYSRLTYTDEISRPCTSPWVCNFALDSPLYLSAAGDENHEKISNAELGVLARWIDQGAQK